MNDSKVHLEISDLVACLGFLIDVWVKIKILVSVIVKTKIFREKMKLFLFTY
jgi:hypothetical protein